jgi:hypothetical protein
MIDAGAEGPDASSLFRRFGQQVISHAGGKMNSGYRRRANEEI